MLSTLAVEYSIISSPVGPDYCKLYDLPSDMVNPTRPEQGIRVGESYTCVRFEMTRQAPGILVPDVISNTIGYFMITEKLRRLLEECTETEIEYLPFDLANHKGRLHPGNFFIANIIGTIACHDPHGTVGTPSRFYPGEFADITQLAFDAAKPPKTARIFRLAARPRVIIVRADLRDALISAGVVAEFLPPEGRLDS